MNIQQIPEHELARLREKAKEITGSQSDYHSSYTELLTRRLNGEPLQYIEEYIPFYSIQINVDQRCLIPRPETEFLIELIKNKSDNPTGLVVTSQDEKSQLKNKNQAMRILRARLLKAEQDKAAAERAKDRKEQVGSGERSDKIRTYNYKDNRVSDHRINLTLKKLDQVLDGDLEEFVVGLIADNEASRLANLEE